MALITANARVTIIAIGALNEPIAPLHCGQFKGLISEFEHSLLVNSESKLLEPHPALLTHAVADVTIVPKSVHEAEAGAVKLAIQRVAPAASHSAPINDMTATWLLIVLAYTEHAIAARIKVKKLKFMVLMFCSQSNRIFYLFDNE